MNKKELLKQMASLYYRIETDLIRMEAKKSPDGLLEMRDLIQEEQLQLHISTKEKQSTTNNHYTPNR